MFDVWHLRPPLNRGLLAGGIVVALIASALAAPGTAHGAIFTVNSTNDVNDGTCNAAHCSLREAINAANTAGGSDLIAFNVGGGGVETIAPTSGLPSITSTMTIDGTTQPGYSGAPLIEITGTAAGSGTSGVTIGSAAVVVRGLSITGFASANGISMFSGSSGAAIEGNYLGVRPNGTALGNNQGIAFGSSGNTIGGLTANKRNVISGNLVNVSIQTGGTDDTAVQGNYIGTDPTGTVALGGQIGIEMGQAAAVVSLDILIGGDTPGARNVISGNTLRGIQATYLPIGTVIEGNYVGLNAAGTGAVPNNTGVLLVDEFTVGVVVKSNVIAGNNDYAISDAGTDTLIEDNLIGVQPDGVTPMGNGNGSTSDAGINVRNTGNPDILGNTIANTDGRGILAAAATNPTIRTNRIHSNSGLGIDIDADNAVDAPCCMTITSAVTSLSVTVISGNVTAPPNTTWVLDFYDSAACDVSGFGEGERYLGLHVVPMGATPFVTFSFVTSVGVSPGRVVTGTVNGASEFSSCVTVPPCGAGDPDCDTWASPQAVKHLGPTNNDSATDNCVNVWNTPQGNTDGNFLDQTPPSTQDDKTWPNSDALGNDCDIDDDNDGLADGVEAGLPFGPCPTASGPTNPLLRDTDGDRVLDGAECSLGTDPLNATSKPSAAACGATTDADGDRLSDRAEKCGYGTNPANTDSDGDNSAAALGARDGCEAASINGDRVVNSGDQLLLVLEILREPSPALRLVSMDVNKDGAVNSGDQLLVAQFLATAGQCP